MTVPKGIQDIVMTTHPWLSFSFDLNSLESGGWSALGEAAAAFGFMRGIPLQPRVAEELHRIYLAKGALATTAIEGNTLSEEEARRQVDGRGNLPPSRQYLGHEIDNVVRAVNRIAQNLKLERHGRVTPELLRQFNSQVLANGIPIAESARPGEYREYNVGVGSYRAVDHAQVDALMARFCEWLNDEFLVEGALTTQVQIVKAVLAHLYFVWIHPFGDGNGRTARLLEFYILLSAGTPSPAAHLLSNHYNQTRSMYYQKLEEASRVASPTKFVRYAVEGLVDGLKEQVEVIKQQQMTWAWESFYHDQLRGPHGETKDRRLRLIEALTAQAAPVPRRSIRTLTGELAVAYNNLTEKAVTRDVNALLSLQLVVRSKDGLRANQDLIKAFVT